MAILKTKMLQRSDRDVRYLCFLGLRISGTLERIGINLMVWMAPPTSIAMCYINVVFTKRKEGATHTGITILRIDIALSVLNFTVLTSMAPSFCKRNYDAAAIYKAVTRPNSRLALFSTELQAF
jgi:hypothetical protein